jgi:hypothetical protein
MDGLIGVEFRAPKAGGPIQSDLTGLRELILRVGRDSVGF